MKTNLAEAQNLQSSDILSFTSDLLAIRNATIST